MVHAQFYASDREDAMVAFTQPVTKRTLYEIGHLPGVRYVEGFRDVPVKLQAGHRSYRTVLLGIPQSAELKRPLDINLFPINISPDGILLTDRLAEHLDVHPGDRVTIYELQGGRTEREAIVTGLVNDLVGLSAYMDFDAVNRLLSEGESITSAAVLIDRIYEDQFYSALKQLPKVSTVIFRLASIQTFLETTGKYIFVFIGILTGFAAIIAIGIVYNNARIALSERVWELASLRVLGFTRREVSSIFLGELAVELLAGIPLGCWIGYLFASASIHLTDTEMFRLPLIIEPKTYAYAVVSILLSGMVSALIVRHRIDHLDLVSTLKTRE
jgi:putative ABC transport system permease protein